jgi:propionyl-CoA carboxylase alpha chain
MMGREVTRERRRAVWLDAHEHRLDVVRADGRVDVTFLDAEDRSSHAVALDSDWKPGEPVWRGTVGGKPAAVQVRTIPNGFELAYQGIRTRAYVYTEREAAAARVMPVKSISDSGKTVRCPMPGLVVSIAVGEGQEVKAGETLAVVEAMKMENVLRAERDGAVKKIHAKPGDSLAVDAVILEFA